MLLRIAKKEKPYIRISYAMLKKYKQAKTENIEIKQEPVVAKTVKLNPKEQRIEKILNEAIRKGEIDSSDIEVKRLELSTYSDSDLNDYEKKVAESYDEDIKEETTSDEKTDAELMLESLRSSGQIANTSFDIKETTSRSLSDAKFDHEMQMQDAKRFMNKDNVTRDGLTFEYGLEQMKENFEKKSHEFVRPKDHVMANLHGITTPIVQTPKQEMSIKDMLKNVDWTINGFK
jgi:hypothetical protein